MMDYYPALLLIHARNDRGSSGLDAEGLRQVAREHWPKMTAEWIERVVERAIAQRSEGQRRIDPKTVDLKHPSVREREFMAASRTAKGPAKEEVAEFVRVQVTAEREIDNEELHRRACKHFSADVSRARTSALARKVRDSLSPSTNGSSKKPKPATSESRPKPPPAQKVSEAPAPKATPPASRIVTPKGDGRLGNTLQLSEDLDGFVRLFVDMRGLEKTTAHRAAAAVHAALAGEAA